VNGAGTNGLREKKKLESAPNVKVLIGIDQERQGGKNDKIIWKTERASVKGNIEEERGSDGTGHERRVKSPESQEARTAEKNE